MTCTRLFIFVLLSPSLVSVGCDDDERAQNDTDTSSTTNSDESTESADPTDASKTTAEASSSGESSESSGSTTQDETTTGSSDPTIPTDPSDGDDDTTAGDSSDGTDGGYPKDDIAARAICESTGGLWDPLACGHYDCGVVSECREPDPGCNCGGFANYETGIGCVEDAACGEFEFPCGDELQCSAPSEFCHLVMLDEKTKGLAYSCVPTPRTCVDNYDCECDGIELYGRPSVCSVGVHGGISVTSF